MISPAMIILIIIVCAIQAVASAQAGEPGCSLSCFKAQARILPAQSKSILVNLEGCLAALGRPKTIFCHFGDLQALGQGPLNLLYYIISALPGSFAQGEEQKQ